MIVRLFQGWILSLVIFELVQYQATAQDGLTWLDAHDMTVEGQAWTETKSAYDRFPIRAESEVREAVWNLSRNAAGICVRFTTDSTKIAVRWSLTSNRLALPHMPATGVSGVDLYLRDGEGRWRWLANGRPYEKEGNIAVLAEKLDGTAHECLLYLPLYNGVAKLEIGVNPDAVIEPLARKNTEARPIVFWGTSITQGACASRPGMVHTAILGRRLNRPILNFGFSGNGRMESEVAKLLAEIDAAIFVVDCNPNLTAPEITERGPNVIEILREAHPNTPIVLVEDREYTDAWLRPEKRKRNLESQAALRAIYERYRDKDPALFYILGKGMLGDDDEATVDSSHPTDLGFVRMADWFEPTLRRALEASDTDK